MFCDICKKIGLSQDAQAAPMSPRRKQTHHQTYASLQRSVSLQCFICTHLWEALTLDEQTFVTQACQSHNQVDIGAAHGGGDVEDCRDFVTVARIGEEEPEYFLWHPSDRLLQIGFEPIAGITLDGQPYWRVSLYLTDNGLSGFLARRHRLTITRLHSP